VKVREGREVHALGVGANERLGREVAYLVNQPVLDGTGHTLIQAGELESRVQLLQQTSNGCCESSLDDLECGSSPPLG